MNQSRTLKKTNVFIQKSFFGLALVLFALASYLGSVFFIEYSSAVEQRLAVNKQEKELKDIREENMRLSIRLTEITSLANLENYGKVLGLISVDASEVKTLKSSAKTDGFSSR